MNKLLDTTTAPVPALKVPPSHPERRHVVPREAKRLLVIDVLRAVAAISVLAHHLPPFTGPLIVLRPWQAIGFIGVGLFLVLSGFSIHYKWAASRIGGEFDQRVFWRRRYFRLVPSYLVAAAIAVAVSYWLGTLIQPTAPWGSGNSLVPWALAWFSQVFFVTANFIPVPALFVTWTIALEFQLYAAYAAVVHFVKRFDPIKITLWALAVALTWRIAGQFVVTCVSAGGFLPDGSSPLQSRVLYGQMPARCFEWFLGMLAAEAYFGNVRLPRWTRSPVLGAVLLVSIGIMQRHPVGGLALGGNHFFVSDLLFDIVVGLGFFCIVNWAINNEGAPWMRVARERPLRSAAYVGLFSYSIYLIHDPVFQVWNHFLGTSNNLAILAEGVVAIGASWIFFKLVERHFLYRR